MDLTNITKKLTDATTALAKADKDLKLEIAGAAADAAGLVDPTPTSDLVGAGISIARGDYWGAALSTVSMVPYLGDAVAKPMKAVRATKSIAALQAKVATLTKTVNDLKKAKKEAEAIEAAAKEAKLAKEAKEAKGTKEGLTQQEKQSVKKDKDCEDCASSGVKPKKLLATEGDVASYKELVKAGKKGDNITPNHIPSAKHMEQHGVSRNDGIAINMEQPVPGTGGRHRETFTYGTTADAKMPPRDALAAGVKDARQIYQKDGLYEPKIREGLQDLIKKNKEGFPEIFKKSGKK